MPVFIHAVLPQRFVAKEKEGIEALTYNERTGTKHIRIILDLLGLAVIKLDVKNIHPWV